MTTQSPYFDQLDESTLGLDDPAVAESDDIDADLDDIPSDPSDIEDEALADLYFAPVSDAKRGKERKAVVPPLEVPPTMSLFDYLRACNPPLDKKIIDIACSKTQTMGDLKEEAAQEICIVWAQIKPDTKKYKPGQIASYANYVAKHAALRVRRDMGSAVRLPGSAFRKRKDGTSYVTAGVLADALNWHDLESWFLGSDENVGDSSMVQAQDPTSALAGVFEGDIALSTEDMEDQELDSRLSRLDDLKAFMTDMQYRIMKDMIEGVSFDDIMTKYNIKKGILLREVAIASSFMIKD